MPSTAWLDRPCFVANPAESTASSSRSLDSCALRPSSDSVRGAAGETHCTGLSENGSITICGADAVGETGDFCCVSDSAAGGVITTTGGSEVRGIADGISRARGAGVASSGRGAGGGGDRARSVAGVVTGGLGGKTGSAGAGATGSLSCFVDAEMRGASPKPSD